MSTLYQRRQLLMAASISLPLILTLNSEQEKLIGVNGVDYFTNVADLHDYCEETLGWDPNGVYNEGGLLNEVVRLTSEGQEAIASEVNKLPFNQQFYAAYKYDKGCRTYELVPLKRAGKFSDSVRWDFPKSRGRDKWMTIPEEQCKDLETLKVREKHLELVKSVTCQKE